ncbi:MAG: LysR family transcriptional regulator [Rhizobium sp.]|nr:LysR family transcriptional regulator [Rhizobium sp.]
MKKIGWDAYEVFIAVAQGGGLTGAAQISGLSPATIGRRVLELEQSIGRTLFARSKSGYALTTDGQMLFDQLKAMESAVRRVESWRMESAGSVTLRLAVGTWNARLVAENFRDICTERDGFRVEMTVTETRAPLAHREHDVALRAHPPEEMNLASRLVGDVAYAAYRAKSAPQFLPERWIAVTEADAISGYLRWPHEKRASDIAVTVTRPRSLLDLVRAGAGNAVLPCFIGDAEPGIERAGDEIPELRHRQWVVTNNDDRSRREIRTLADRLTKLLKAHQDLYAGKRPVKSS